MAKASDLNKVKGTGMQRGVRRGLPKPFPNRILHPKGGPLTMSGSKPYGIIGDIGHSINKFVGGGDHKKGAERISTAAHHVNKFVGGGDAKAGARKIRKLPKKLLKAGLKLATGGFGGKPANHLPKGKNFPKRTTNKTKTGLVNKHKYKKGTMMV